MTTKTKLATLYKGLLLASLSLIYLAETTPLYAAETTSKSIIVNDPHHPGHLVKLRPFMANRKLPSRADLAIALEEQQAKMAEQDATRLSGQVSAFTNVGQFPEEKDAQVTYTQESTARRYNKFSHLSKATSFLHRSIQRIQAIQENQGPQQETVNSTASKFIVPQTEQANNQQSLTAPAAPAQFTFLRMAEQHLLPSNQPLGLSINPVASVNSETDQLQYGSAGPTAFSAQSFTAISFKTAYKKHLAAGAAVHPSSQASSFGSWHSGITLHNNLYQNQLAPAGFHSYLQTASLHSQKENSALPAVTYGGYAPKAAVYYRPSTTKANSRKTAQHKQTHTCQAKIATYPSYPHSQ